MSSLKLYSCSRCPQVPVSGVTQRDLHTLARWVAGLMCLDALPLGDLTRVGGDWVVGWVE